MKQLFVSMDFLHTTTCGKMLMVLGVFVFHGLHTMVGLDITDTTANMNLVGMFVSSFVNSEIMIDGA